MEPITVTIVSALATGAAAALTDVAGQAVKDAYAGLKSVLAGRLDSLGLIEQEPKNETFRAAAAEEIHKKDLTADAEVLAKLCALTEALEQEPPDQRQQLGIDIQEVHAIDDVIIRQIESLGGVVVHDVTGRSIQIEGIRTGPPGGN